MRCERVKFYNSSPVLWISLPRPCFEFPYRDVRLCGQRHCCVQFHRHCWNLLSASSHPAQRWDYGMYTQGGSMPRSRSASRISYAYLWNKGSRDLAILAGAVRGTAYFPRAMRGLRVWRILGNVGRMLAGLEAFWPGPAGRVNAFTLLLTFTFKSALIHFWNKKGSSFFHSYGLSDGSVQNPLVYTCRLTITLAPGVWIFATVR